MDFKRITEIDLYRCWKGLVNGGRFIALFTLICTLLGIAASVTVVKPDNEYDATASTYSIVYGSYTESSEAISALRTYIDIVKSYKVAKRAALLLGDDSIGTEDVYDMTEVDPLVVEGTTYLYEQNSSVIRIHAVSKDRETAVKVVNAVAEAFVMEVNGISDEESARVLDYAYDADLTYNATLARVLVTTAGLVGGFILACFVLLARIVFSDKVVTVNDIKYQGQFEVVGVIPRFKPEGGERTRDDDSNR